DPVAATQIHQLLDEYAQFYKPQSPFERDCLEEIALCRVRLARLDRTEAGLYIEGKEKAFATHTIVDANGKTIRRFDQQIFPFSERPAVGNMHLSAAWRPANDLFETLSRQEARISNRLRKALQLFRELLAERPTSPVDLPEVPQPPAESAPPPPTNTPKQNEAGPTLTLVDSRPPAPFSKPTSAPPSTPSQPAPAASPQPTHSDEQI